MEKVFKHGQMLKITEHLVTEYYNSANVDGILALMDEGAVVFGEHLTGFLMGNKKIADFLHKELAKQMPCYVYKMRSNEIETDDGVTVTVHVILKGGEYASLRWYNIMFMYKGDLGNFRLVGMNFKHDLHHEASYRIIRARVLHNKQQNKIARHRTPGIVGDTVNVCAVSYTLADEGHTLYSYDYHFAHMLGYSSEAEVASITGGFFTPLVHADDWELVRQDFQIQVLEQDMYQLEYRMRCKDGSYIWVLECGKRSLDKHGKHVCRSILTDISTLKNAHDDLLKRASYDELTGVYNKRTFYRKARELMADNPDKQFQMLRMNVARFKVINELMGEEEGDKLLKDIGSFLTSMNLPYCVSGRLYSDNFVICFSASDDITTRMVRSLRYIASSFNLRHRTVLNFGLYRIDDLHVPVSVMCDRANIALMRSKGNFNDPFCEYDDEMRRQMVVEQEILNLLEKALDEREFKVYLQPKYDTRTNTLVGAEALVRWLHNEMDFEGNVNTRFISPGDFVPVFERNGLIYSLDKYIWEETCRLIWRWLREGKDVKPISVNVSRVDLYDPGLVNFLVTLRDRYEIPHHLLELELTESAYTNDPMQIIEVTDRLKEAGFTILMDDFGSGYSSLNMLKDVHVDVLKLDMGFLNSSDQSGRGGNILTAVVGMAINLNLQIIAEGVETIEQVEFLKSIGCNVVQGYYYSKPLPSEEYSTRLESLV